MGFECGCCVINRISVAFRRITLKLYLVLLDHRIESGLLQPVDLECRRSICDLLVPILLGPCKLTVCYIDLLIVTFFKMIGKL